MNTYAYALLALLLTACAPQAPLMHDAAGQVGSASTTPAAEPAKTPPKAAVPGTPAARSGEMAFAAEKVAKEAGCYRAEGATLMAKRAGIQFYRVACDSGRQVLVKCELRQCQIAD